MERSRGNAEVVRAGEWLVGKALLFGDLTAGSVCPGDRLQAGEQLTPQFRVPTVEVLPCSFRNNQPTLQATATPLPRGGRLTAPTACVGLWERVFLGSQASANQDCREQFIKPRVDTIKCPQAGSGVTVLCHGHRKSCSQGDTPPTPGLTPSPPGSHPHHHHPAQTRCSIPSVPSLLFWPLPPSPPLRPQPQRKPEGQREEDAKPSATHPPTDIPTLPQTQAPHIQSGLPGTRVLTSPLP